MASEENWNSLPGMMLGLARRWPERPMLRYWRGGAWRGMSWAEYAMAVAAAAAGLRQRGVSPGDRVLIVSENRPEFIIADTAIMAIGAVSVPTYTTNTVADHAHILRDSGARAAIVSTPKLAGAVAEAAGLGGLDLLVTMDQPDGADAGDTVSWTELVATPPDLAMLVAEVEHIPPGRLACLIYTSGTGGAPKGVMLPHRAMLANRHGVTDFIRKLNLPQDACYLSFLPLSHAYEHTVGNFLLPSFGIEVVYSRGAEKLSAELQQIRPAVVTAVPRLFEVLRARILAGLDKESSLTRRFFEATLRLGLRKMDGQELNPWERVQDAVLDRLVRKKMRDRFGGRLAALVSGGARLDPELSGFFLALGLPVIQGYGQTEAGPVISVNLPWDNRRHTVGKVLDGVEARIAPDGEVLVRGALVMDGYWNNPAATAAALQDLHDGGAPWLHTGDVGEITQGYLRITDRKRDIIKTLGGDMVSPARIEGMLMAEPEIAQAVVAGDGRAGLAALLVPAEGKEANLSKAVARVNSRLSSIERIRYTLSLPPFTVEDGTMTPTMKIKRRAVLEAHAAALDRLYG
ncbi:long-chain fatty acid--CoA ligase [Pseudoroseomonas wenyumeiae]|uniref:Long-chain fatty acid--CoA ligase n=1 Tax=Teichococcus wenyumeiae TaxID=2478470 RepID=A0A3A9JDZ6_9PROT|nr:long-chain fatty acid--CoA ligase [Pseudoroseomonas wenyumeiae]RKK05567.1 long-chain fatty acid--CoA ligase [Pseudoroseomonas wenyumeiae]RMI19953.1 long-chain fatty acid--CoA ligase [Pseudoroseomonas wenyumeiae]